ncbi:MAG: IS1182 family transposase [Gemmiger sp.]|uniref:IS1182 family transposase n=1 Tax=Gemmiger sp. TaxID=2049027 RepID=UPI002A80C379|nr:IS1182 family transposase [Gemmiger sp.]MDY4880206.1 IS1182 family transposase [Gemmiger sp.]
MDTLVPKDHLLRKIEKVMDYDWLYERLEGYYCHTNGRPGTDPVVLIKMVLLQHLFGIPSLRQTYREVQVNLAYRWFLGYGLLDEIPHFATVSYAFCKRFPEELTDEIFQHILNKALNNGDDDSENGSGGTTEKTVSTTDPDCGMFVKGEHERQFAYEAHTACNKRGFVLGVQVTAGNIHDSVAWDELYTTITRRFNDIRYAVMDSAYKTPWIAKRTIDDGIVPILPYTRYKGAKGSYRPWEYAYLPEKDAYLCPQGAELRHTTTDKDGKRVYRSTPKNCRDCPYKAKCGANEKGQKLLTRHIWQFYLDAVECIRKTEDAKCIYAMRQQTIERVFADAKEKHAMRYTHHRGLTAVTRWVKLKFAAMNLKKLAVWSWKDSFLLLLSLFPIRVFHKTRHPPCLAAF